MEWRGLILFGLYLGHRLGDLAKLTWHAVDLDSGEIAFTARKTGQRILPLVHALLDYLWFGRPMITIARGILELEIQLSDRLLQF